MANKNGKTRGAGPPNKEQQIKNKIAKMEADLKTAILKGNQKIVANYLKYLEVLDNAALGTLKGCSPTNQISSAKVLMEKAENLIAEEKKAEKEESEDNQQETVQTLAPLISLTPAKEA